MPSVMQALCTRGVRAANFPSTFISTELSVSFQTFCKSLMSLSLQLPFRFPYPLIIAISLFMHPSRCAVRPESPIEEVSNAFYGKTIKFAMTHDVEVDLPEIVFNGATFRISPRSIEGNGLIAKLELIPKQVVQARLAGTMIKKKIRK